MIGDLSIFRNVYHNFQIKISEISLILI